MNVSETLFTAILSMDSYNRGYNAGIINGSLTEIKDTSRIGNAKISYTLANADLLDEAVAADFYAVAYDWNGETVISYRGTDGLTELADLLDRKDVPYGWPLGGEIMARRRPAWRQNFR